MSDIIIHIPDKPIDPGFLAQLEKFLTRYEATLDKDAWNILKQSQSKQENEKRLSLEEFIKETEAFSKRVGPQKTDSTDLIREDRDSR